MRRATTLTISVACVSLALMAACTKEEAKPVSKPAAQAPAPTPAPPPVAAAPAPAAQPAPASATAAAPAAAPTPVLASAEYTNDPQLRCDLLEVKRASGGSLTVRWRLVNTAGQPQGMVASSPKAIDYTYQYHELYYTDPAENKKYGFLSDSQQNRLMQVWHGHLEAGQQRGNWAKFPAPPATSKKITIHIPNFPPFEDIPVAE